MTNILWRALTFATIVTFSSSAFAEDVVIPSVPTAPNEPDVGAVIVPLKKGKIAPFTGLELSPAAVAQIVADLDSITEQIKVEVDVAVKKEQAQCLFKLNEQKIAEETKRSINLAQINSLEKQNKVFRDRIRALETDQPNLPLWVAGGFVVGVTLTGVVSYVIVKATQ
jgi:hypothetical protein